MDSLIPFTTSGALMDCVDSTSTYPRCLHIPSTYPELLSFPIHLSVHPQRQLVYHTHILFTSAYLNSCIPMTQGRCLSFYETVENYMVF